jgi:hypothetical protein
MNDFLLLQIYVYPVEYWTLGRLLDLTHFNIVLALYCVFILVGAWL